MVPLHLSIVQKGLCDGKKGSLDLENKRNFNINRNFLLHKKFFIVEKKFFLSHQEKNLNIKWFLYKCHKAFFHN